uniref:Uncharacterized protein n=1 Tax=Lutzomyia longipalpis TaxID=7200 RepID=A0A1B0EX59_LUTLO
SDDPYYCGLRARVPNFVKTSKAPPAKHHNGHSVHEKETPKRMSLAHLQHPASLQSLHQLHQMHPHPHLMSAHQQQMMWHARSFESGIDSELVESPYNHIYGRIPLPTRGYIPPPPRTMYIGEWD